ncbi:MAG: hypothetical protein LBR58_08570 [Propionibacteriaceae bacterium]|nr:hypothetical protein [Propionibacteriaceae bacterium]
MSAELPQHPPGARVAYGYLVMMGASVVGLIVGVIASTALNGAMCPGTQDETTNCGIYPLVLGVVVGVLALVGAVAGLGKLAKLDAWFTVAAAAAVVGVCILSLLFLDWLVPAIAALVTPAIAALASHAWVRPRPAGQKVALFGALLAAVFYALLLLY